MGSASLTTVMRRLRCLANAAEIAEVADRQLVQHFADGGDEQAFAELVRRHGALVFQVCRRVLGHYQDAEDAFQATFLVLARRAGAIRRKDSLAAWLHGVAYRTAMKIKTTAATRRTRQPQPEPRPVPEPVSEAALRELQSALDAEIARLPEKLREPFVLCCLENRTKSEAARELGWKEGTVSGRLAEARARLRQRLARRGFELSAVLAALALGQGDGEAALLGRMTQQTIQAGVLFADAGTAASAVIPAHVRLLAEAMLRVLRGRRLLLGLLLPLVLGMAGAGAAILNQHRVNDQAPAQAHEQAPPITDRYGDPLPAGAVTRFGTTRFRHQHTVRSLAWSRDGRWLVSGSWDHTVRIWDAVTGRLRRRLTGHPGGLFSVAISPDSRLIASGDMERTFILWEAATGRQLLRQGGLENSVRVLFSPDGATLAVSAGGVVHLWDVAGRQERLRLAATPRELGYLAVFSPDSKRLAVAGTDQVVRLFDVATGRSVQRLTGAGDRVLSLRFTADGKRLLASAGPKDPNFHLWDTASGRELRRFAEPAGWDGPVAVSPDGKTFACGSQRSAFHLFDAVTGKRLHTCRLPGSSTEWITALAFSPDGKRLASAATSKTIRLWDVASGRQLPHPAAHEGEVCAIVPLPDERRVLTAGRDGSLYLWDAMTGRIGASWDQPGGLSTAVVSSMGHTVAWTEGKLIRLRDLKTGTDLGQLAGHAGAVEALAFAPDGTALASGGWQDHTVRMWDVRARRERWHRDLPKPHGHNVGPSPLVFTPDGKVLVSGSADRTNGTIYFWDAATGRQLRQMPCQASVLAISRDGRTLVAAGWDGLQLFDMATNQVRLRLLLRDQQVALSPDGRMLATGGHDGVLHLWEVATGRERRRFRGHETGVSPDGRGSFAAGVSALAFAADSRRLFSGGGDTTVLLWDTFALDAPASTARLAPEEAEACWRELGSPDAARAFGAMRRLLAAPTEAVRGLATQLVPAAPADPARVASWIGQLDSPRFAVREQATAELTRLEDRAAPFLKQALAARPSAEAARRLRGLLDALGNLQASPTIRRALRAVEVLEHLHNPEARRVLERLARGAGSSRLTREARSALQRQHD